MEIGEWFRPNLRQDNHSEQNTASGAGGLSRSCLVFGPNRLYLKYPPTAVGSINDQQLGLLCRLHLNNPPIPIGGIKNRISLFHQPANYQSRAKRRKEPKTIARFGLAPFPGFVLEPILFACVRPSANYGLVP